MNAILCHLLCITYLCLTWVGNAQNFYYYYLGSGTTCKGEGEITSDGLNEVVTYDASAAYKAEGWTKSRATTVGNVTTTRYYSVTMCGDLANTTCEGDWCFEEVNATNKDECFEGLARWEENDNTTITYGVYYNETSDESSNSSIPDKPVALHIQITDINQLNKDCPSKISYVNYNLYCKNSATSTTITALWSNYSACIWNVSFLSPYGCVTTSAIDTSNASTTTSSSLSTTHSSIIIVDNGNNDNNELSTGSVLVIIFVVVILTYLILGCAYNSFYHGRVGIDAIPNKNGWTQLWRYFKAGCETTYDTLCCQQGNVDYQNL